MLTTKQPLDFALFSFSLRRAGGKVNRPCFMSFLTPLFFLGVAALAAPILVHLVRAHVRVASSSRARFCSTGAAAHDSPSHAAQHAAVAACAVSRSF
jgi:hypothetical protein